MIVACCVCGKVRQPDKTWEIQMIPEGEEVSHGYCPECSIAAFEEIQQYHADYKK